MFVSFLMTLRLLGWASIFLLKQRLVNVYFKSNNRDLQGIQPVFSSFFQICISQIPLLVNSYDHRLYSENKVKILWQFKRKALISSIYRLVQCTNLNIVPEPTQQKCNFPFYPPKTGYSINAALYKDVW